MNDIDQIIENQKNEGAEEGPIPLLEFQKRADMGGLRDEEYAEQQGEQDKKAWEAQLNPPKYGTLMNLAAGGVHYLTKGDSLFRNAAHIGIDYLVNKPNRQFMDLGPWLMDMTTITADNGLKTTKEVPFTDKYFEALSQQTDPELNTVISNNASYVLGEVAGAGTELVGAGALKAFRYVAGGGRYALRKGLGAILETGVAKKVVTQAATRQGVVKLGAIAGGEGVALATMELVKEQVQHFATGEKPLTLRHVLNTMGTMTAGGVGIGVLGAGLVVGAPILLETAGRVYSSTTNYVHNAIEDFLAGFGWGGRARRYTDFTGKEVPPVKDYPPEEAPAALQIEQKTPPGHGPHWHPHKTTPQAEDTTAPLQNILNAKDEADAPGWTKKIKIVNKKKYEVTPAIDLLLLTADDIGDSLAQSIETQLGTNIQNAASFLSSRAAIKTKHLMLKEGKAILDYSRMTTKLLKGHEDEMIKLAAIFKDMPLETYRQMPSYALIKLVHLVDELKWNSNLAPQMPALTKIKKDILKIYPMIGRHKKLFDALNPRGEGVKGHEEWSFKNDLSTFTNVETEYNNIGGYLSQAKLTDERIAAGEKLHPYQIGIKNMLRLTEKRRALGEALEQGKHGVHVPTELARRFYHTHDEYAKFSVVKEDLGNILDNRFAELTDGDRDAFLGYAFNTERTGKPGPEQILENLTSLDKAEEAYDYTGLEKADIEQVITSKLQNLTKADREATMAEFEKIDRIEAQDNHIGRSADSIIRCITKA